MHLLSVISNWLNSQNMLATILSSRQIDPHYPNNKTSPDPWSYSHYILNRNTRQWRSRALIGSLPSYVTYLYNIICWRTPKEHLTYVMLIILFKFVHWHARINIPLAHVLYVLLIKSFHSNLLLLLKLLC